MKKIGLRESIRTPLLTTVEEGGVGGAFSVGDDSVRTVLDSVGDGSVVIG